MNVLKMVDELQKTTEDNYIRIVLILDEEGKIYEPFIVETEDGIAYIKVAELT